MREDSVDKTYNKAKNKECEQIWLYLIKVAPWVTTAVEADGCSGTSVLLWCYCGGVK